MKLVKNFDGGALPAPFDWPLDAPLKLEVKVQAVAWPDVWHMPLKPFARSSGSQTTVTLIPYGCAKQYHISMFPVLEKATAYKFDDEAAQDDLQPQPQPVAGKPPPPAPPAFGFSPVLGDWMVLVRDRTHKDLFSHSSCVLCESLLLLTLATGCSNNPPLQRPCTDARPSAQPP